MHQTFVDLYLAWLIHQVANTKLAFWVQSDGWLQAAD
jgi:hypothetical protein